MVEAWDIRSMVYQGVNIGLAAVAPRGMAFKPDGTRVFVVDSADDKVKNYLLTVANDISSAAITADEFQLEAGAQGFEFNGDGTKIFYVDGQTIKERTLGAAYTLAGAGAATTLNVAADLASTDPQDVRFGDSGNKLFFTDDNDLSVHLYDLATPYLISSATFNAGKVLDLSSRFPLGDGLVGLYLKTDGKKLFVGVGFDTDGSFQVQTPAIREFSLSVAWDLATATEIASEDPDAAQLISFMPHFYSGSHDWVLGRKHRGTTGSVIFGIAGTNSAILIGNPTPGEGGVDWDNAQNETFWNGHNSPTTWEGQIRFTRRPDNASLGGDNRLMVGSDDSIFHSKFTDTLARPWSLVWRDTDEVFGLMASGSGIQVSAGAEGGNWIYGEKLDFTVQREAGPVFHFWLKGKYYGSRSVSQPTDVDKNGFAYGKNGGIAGWDFASGLEAIWFRSYALAKHLHEDLASATHNLDQTALNIIGRSIVDETGRESTATYIAFSANGNFVFAASNDASVQNAIYQYNLGVSIPSCTGAGFKPYVSGGTVRLNVSTVFGAHHLEGETVKAVIDGALFDVPIVNGKPQFPAGVTGAHVQVGLGYIADIVTLGIEQGDGRMQGKEKAVKELLLKFYKSAMPLIGPDKNRLIQMKHPEKFDFDEPLPLFTGQVEQRIERDWNKDGKVVIRMKDPYPMTVIAIAPDVPEVEDD